MRRNALAGAVIWIALAAASQLHWVHVGLIELLFLLGPLIVTPLGIGLAARFMQEQGISVPIRFARWVQFPAAIFAAASFWLPQGKAAAIVALLGWGSDASSVCAGSC